MEESKELQGFYKIFRSVIYVSILLEFFEYAIDPAMLDHWGGILCDIHGRIKRWVIYNDGNLAYSKLATFLLICITCIGTRNKKKLEFNARKQVLYPIIIGMGLVVLSVWLFGYPMETRLYTLRLNIWLYMLASIIGVVLVHIALDNISKFLKEGLLKDRFNFENESFEQCRELQENKYSVNIPMRYYYRELEFLTMPGVAGEQVFGQYPHALLLPGEVPQRLGEHQQSVQRHMGSRYTGFRQDFLHYRTVYPATLSKRFCLSCLRL